MKPLNKKALIFIIVGIICILLVTFLVISIVINENNKKIKNGDNIYIVIEQQVDSNPSSPKQLLYKEKFTTELRYDVVLESVINPGHTNRVVIENGTCKVIESTCPTHSCEAYPIQLTTTLFNNNISATCLPNGLFIYLTNE